MKKTLLMISLFACLSGVMHALPCAGGTLATYTAGGFSCTLDGLTFSGFSYTPSASGLAQVPDAGGVLLIVRPIAGENGLQCSSAWLAGSGQTEDSLIRYTATCNGCLIDDLVLIMGGGAKHGAIASVSETSVKPFVSLLTGGIDLEDMTTLSPGVTTITLTKDIGLSGGEDPNGIAHISAVSNLFSTNTTTTMTPEPALGLLSLGLLGMIPVARRKLRR